MGILKFEELPKREGNARGIIDEIERIINRHLLKEGACENGYYLVWLRGPFAESFALRSSLDVEDIEDIPLRVRREIERRASEAGWRLSFSMQSCRLSAFGSEGPFPVISLQKIFC